MSKKSVPDVLILGAGPAGMAIASALGKEKLDVEVLSPNGPDEPWPNTYGIWGEEVDQPLPPKYHKCLAKVRLVHLEKELQLLIFLSLKLMQLPCLRVLHPKQEHLSCFLLTLNINLIIKEIYGTKNYFCDLVFIFHPILVTRVD